MKVLMVCLGNICRSPLAEGIFRAKAKEKGLDIEVDSAGTSNWHAGEHPDPRAIKIAASKGVDISKLTARQFVVEDFDRFDLILAMDINNQKDILNLARTEGDRAKVKLFLDFAKNPINKSVPDPYFGDQEGFTKVYDMLLETSDLLCDYCLKK